MALDNLISVEIPAADVGSFLTKIEEQKTILQGKVINLTPNERRRYARVSYEMIPWVQKCYQYMQTNPELKPGYIDLVELAKDMQTRNDLYSLYTALREVFESVDDTLLLVGNDIYTNCIAFYQAVKAASKANVPGSTSIYEDLAQQFPGRPRNAGGNPPPTP